MLTDGIHLGVSRTKLSKTMLAIVAVGLIALVVGSRTAWYSTDVQQVQDEINEVLGKL